MPRILFWIVLLIVAGWYWRRSQRPRRPSGGTAARGGAAAGQLRLPEPMVQCAECGTHAPASESIAEGGHYFCSRDHAQRYAAARRRTQA